jgi:hypothetical protein
MLESKGEQLRGAEVGIKVTLGFFLRLSGSGKGHPVRQRISYGLCHQEMENLRAGDHLTLRLLPVMGACCLDSDGRVLVAHASVGHAAAPRERAWRKGDRQRVGLHKRNCTSSKKVWSNRVIFILSILSRRMRKTKDTPDILRIKPEIRTWHAFEGPLGDVVHNKRFFFAWKEGCLMGTYNTLEEATASLTSKKTRDRH